MNTHKALIVIDMQNDYYPGGRMELDRIEETHTNTLSLIKYARKRNMPIYFIQHLADTNAPFFAEGTSGADLYEGLPISPDDTIITKHYPNSFRETTLLKKLSKHAITDLLICGAMTHMCIDTSVRAAYDLGYHVTLIGDACATRPLSYMGATVSSAQVQTAFLAALDGTFAEVVTVADIL